MQTNVPSITWTPQGPQIPQEADILAGVQADQQVAFGGGMSTSLSEPQGQLAQSQTAIIADKNNQIAALVSQVDPDTASGRWQDAIGRIYFTNRIPEAGTLVTANCVGLVGTIIPVGSLAQDTAGNQYTSLAAAAIPASGTVSVQFQCLTPGPIGCAIGALNTIVKAQTGWDTVSNPTAGTPGQYAETAAAFEQRRRDSVANNAVNSIQSVLASVLAVPNVLDAYVTDNSTSATVNTGSTNFPVLANSIYVAVAGGTSAAIAQAIWSKKSLGCQYSGGTSFVYTDTSAGVTPYPTYTVKWQTPTSTRTYFAVQLANNSNLPSNITQLVQNAIVTAFNGQDGGQRARIGSTVYASRFYAGISAISQYVNILSLTLGTSASPTGTSVAYGIDQLPSLNASDIAVTFV